MASTMIIKADLAAKMGDTLWNAFEYAFEQKINVIIPDLCGYKISFEEIEKEQEGEE